MIHRNSSRDRDKRFLSVMTSQRKMCEKKPRSRLEDDAEDQVKDFSSFAIIKMSSQHLPTRHSSQTTTTTATTATTATKTFKFKQRQFHSLVLVLAFQILVTSQGGHALRQSHYVHWNTTNPIFRIDNTDHIIDVNRGNKPWEYDQVNIICPVYRPGTHIDDMETYVIYSVSKDEYESCRITNPNPRVIAICNKPHELMYFTITFRSFTPTPGGMEFQPGEDYYFISTSAKGDLYRRAGGHCSSHHMKVAFKVANNQNGEDLSTTSKPRQVVNAPRHYGHDGDTSSIANNRDNDHDEEVGDDEDLLQTYWSGKGYYERRMTPSVGGRPNKKRNDDNFERHPNEVVKHEASRMASNAQPLKVSVLTLILLFLPGFALSRSF